jgi:hypothetical protein
MPTRIAVDCPKELRAPNDPPPVARRPPGKESTLRSPPGLSVWLTNCGFVGEMFCGPPPSVECTTPDTRTLHCVQVGPALGNATRFQIAPFFYRDGVGHCHLTPTLTCAIRDQPCPVPETPEVECPVPYPHDDPPDPPHW